MRYLKLFSLPIIILIGLFKPIPVLSANITNSMNEPIQVITVTQKDLNLDKKPDMTVIDCVFATGHDRVLVVDPNGDMPIGNKWEDITDFQDDVWIFDTGADGTAQLIVKFGIENGKYIALLYDDIDGDGVIDHHLSGNQVIIDETKFWHVKVESEEPWSRAPDSSNLKVTFLIDGYNGLRYPLGLYTGLVGNGIDGELDWQVDIGDKDGDRVIDYELAQAISLILINNHGFGIHKAAIFAKATNRKPDPYANTVFWPFLIDIANIRGGYFDHPPVIAINWDAGVIDSLGILGFPTEEGYHIADRLPLEKNTINLADFENPMAYYDMANDHDGWPELQVRFNVSVPYDPYFPPSPYAGKIGTPNVEVDYSWDENNDNRWDYKLNLSSNEQINNVVNFPDFSIKSVPYEEIIPLVKNKNWDVAMLVFDSQPSMDSEGMYGKGWMINRGYSAGESIEPSGLNDRFMLGFSNQPPIQNYQDIQDFMRGEYNFQYNNTPKVYLSSLDHQLHLYSAQSGVWNLGAGNYIRYANLDGDAYLDQWQEQSNGIVVQQVNFNKDIIVYSGNGIIRLKQVNTLPSLYESAPPGNYDEWQNLDVTLKTNPPISSPTDFQDMLAQFAGSEMQIQGATISDYHTTADGFQFVMELLPGFKVIRTGWKDLEQNAPGQYLVVYDPASKIGGLFQLNYLPWIAQSAATPSTEVTQDVAPHDSIFHLIPLTATQLSIHITTHKQNPLTADGIYQVNLKANNAGNQDSEDLVVSLQAVCGDNLQKLLVAPTKVLGEGQLEWKVNWQAIPNKDCQLSATLNTKEEVTVAQAHMDIPASAPVGSMQAKVLETSTQNYQIFPSFIILGMLGVITGLIFWFNRNSRKKTTGVYRGK